MKKTESMEGQTHMTKTIRSALALCALLVGALSYTAAAYACDGQHGDGDHQAAGANDTRFASFDKNTSDVFKFTTTLTSPDSGTCGNDWANDTIKRTYVVKKADDGTYRVIAFDRGTFTTLAGKSPGSCDPANPHHGTTVTAGIQGHMGGFAVEKVTGGTFNAHATCATVCDRSAFVAAFFGASAQHSVQKYLYIYMSKDDHLTQHVWLDRGNATTGVNRGDIATA